MPSRSYRFKLRSQNNNLYITPHFINSISGNNDLLKIQQYFYTVIDMIISFNNFTLITNTLNSIKGTISDTETYYDILSRIEGLIIELVNNITYNNTNEVQLIPTSTLLNQINTIKNNIKLLPPDSDYFGSVSESILQIICSIISGFNFTNIRNDINTLKLYTQQKYGIINGFVEIQDQIFKVIDLIISDVIVIGSNSNRINFDVQVIRRLIRELPISL